MVLAAPERTAESSLEILANLDAPDAYEWSLYHLLQNEDVIKNAMFDITYFQANGASWTQEGRARPRYENIGETNYRSNLDDRTLSLIADAPPVGVLLRSNRLLDMAVVIRSKDAGINQLTFDIIFTSAENYEAALHSNVFSSCNMPSYWDCRASASSVSSSSIPVTPSRSRSTGRTSRHRRMSATFSEPQQQTAVKNIAIYATMLAKASSF